MSELRDLLDREAVRVSAPPDALSAVLGSVDRRRRNRKVRSAVLAIVVALVAIGAFVKVFQAHEPVPVGPPEITVGNVRDMEMAWTAKEPGGCCPTATVSGDRVYVAGKEVVSAYDLDCGQDGATCTPVWVGDPGTVRHYLLAPVVGDGMVFAVDGKDLYAFAEDCAIGGATCTPAWVAPLHHDSDPLAPVVGGGMVFTTGGSRVFGYPTHCGVDGATCHPTWSAHGGGQPGVGSGFLFGSECYSVMRPCADLPQHRVLAWSLDCIASGASCSPEWFGLVRGMPAYLNPPEVSDGRVYVAGGNRLYGFDLGCGSDGARCDPVWVGATHEPPPGRVWDSAVADGMVFAGASTRGGLYAPGPGSIYAFQQDCGMTICQPTWKVDTIGVPHPAVRNGVLLVGTHRGGSFQAYPTLCEATHGTCRPLWQATTFDHGRIFDHVTTSPSSMCAGSDSGRVYCYAVHGGRAAAS